MPYKKDSKCKHTCKHSYYKVGLGWCCEKHGECFMCSLCSEFEWKEEYGMERGCHE